MKVSALPHCGMLCIIAAVTCLAYDVPDLLEAVKRRDHKTLKTLIKARADVNVAQLDGATALAWAIYLDDQEAAEMLLAAGAKVNTADEYGETPLTLACGVGNVVLVKRLIEAGADVNATPLHTAAQLGDIELVKILLAKGADPNARNEKALMRGVPAAGPFRPPAGEITPLHVATRAGQSAWPPTRKRYVK